MEEAEGEVKGREEIKSKRIFEKEVKEASEKLEFESKKISYDFEERLETILRLLEKHNIHSVYN